MTEPEQTEVIMRHHNLAAALAAFQADRPTLTKTNPVDVIKEGRKLYSYSYADLADVEEVVLPLLGAHGLAWHCHTEAAGREMRLVCTLEHESGDMRSSAFPLDVKLTDPQGMGSYLTYFQRYALMMMTGVHAAGEDDDGQRAQAVGRQEPEHRRQDRPDPGPGTRQGGADEAAKALVNSPLDRLPQIWERVIANGVAGNTLSPQTKQGFRDYLAGQDIDPVSTVGIMASMVADGSVRAVAAFRLAREASEAVTEQQAAAVDKAYMAMCRADQQFSGLRVPGGDTLGDYVALHAAAKRREPWDATPQERQANSDPEVTPGPPWAHDATDQVAVDHDSEFPGGDDDAAEPDGYSGRPAALEGT